MIVKSPGQIELSESMPVSGLGSSLASVLESIPVPETQLPCIMLWVIHLMSSSSTVGSRVELQGSNSSMPGSRAAFKSSIFSTAVSRAGVQRTVQRTILEGSQSTS